MSKDDLKVLLIGYGNPGRLDDGLGPALAVAIEQRALPGVTVDADYQLMLEDAEVVAKNDVVVFADAAIKGAEPFSFQRIEPIPEVSFSTHSIQPTAVLGVAHKLFKARTEGYVLGIRGYEFNEYKECLSDKARENLNAAVAFIERTIRDGSFAEVASEGQTILANSDAKPDKTDVSVTIADGSCPIPGAASRKVEP